MMVRQVHFLLALLLLPTVQAGWGSNNNNNNNNNNNDMTIYADSFTRDWMYDSTAISMKLEGCYWGYVYDSEEAGCMEDESEDGTYYWYQMANCRRAQAVFSLYATDSSSSAGCSSNTYKETFVTKVGLPDFIAYLKEYDENSPFSDDDNGDDDGYGGWNLDELPLCEQAEDGYLGLSCGDDGTFTIDYFYDEYCLQSTGTYNDLYKLNSQLKTYQSCVGIYSSNNGDSTLLEYLVPYAESCTSLDSDLCTDDSTMSNRRSSAGSGGRRHGSSSNKAASSWGTKLKYALGGLLLFASFILFTGILFTNRRRRRALMQRKFKQSLRPNRDEKSRRTSKMSRSKSRDKEKRSRSKRSRSRNREENMLT